MASGREGEGGAIRRPGQPTVLVLPCCHRHRVAPAVPLHGQDEDVRRPVDDPADAVETGEEPCDAAGRLVLLLLLAVSLLVPLTARERQARAVRRPAHLADLVLPC